jgi:thiol-disulfide isomerase/thioredoxin
MQPSLNKNAEPEREAERRPAAPAELLSLPESVLERQIKALDKGSFRLADYQGKVMVINLWASWCGPCRREAPEYEKVRQAYLGREVEFIGLTDEDPRTAADRVKRFVREVKYLFRVGWADSETTRVLANGRNAIPQTLVIDTNGHIVNHWVGAQTGSRLREAIERALDH